MQVSLRIVDETNAGRVQRESRLVLVSSKVTAREVIVQRVRQEVELTRQRLDQPYAGLVEPVVAERRLNDERKGPRAPDADAMCQAALDGFESNRFFMLANDRQIESLDEEIIVTPDTTVSFIKLVPLVGG